MKITTFRAFVRTQSLLLKIPYSLMGLASGLVGLVVLYQYAYTRQTQIAHDIKDGTAGGEQLSAMIEQLTSTMGWGAASILTVVVVGFVLTAWRVRVLEAAYRDEVLRRLDNELLARVARAEEMDGETRWLAQQLLTQRAPGWSMADNNAKP